MLDKLLFRVMPCLFLIAIGLLYYPPTSRVIRSYVANWYYSRHRTESPATSELQPTRTRSIPLSTSHWSQASCSSVSSTSV
jgi:hypothetical protein